MYSASRQSSRQSRQEKPLVTTAVDRQLLCRNVYMQVLHTPRYTDVLVDWLAYTRRDGSLTYSGPHYGRGFLEQ